MEMEALTFFMRTFVLSKLSRSVTLQEVVVLLLHKPYFTSIAQPTSQDC